MIRQTPWWREQGAELARSTIAAAKRVEQATEPRYAQLLDSACLYGDVSGWNDVERVQSSSGTQQENVIANAIDTLVSEITQTQIRPMALTVGGDWWKRQKAKKLTAYWDSELRQLRMRFLLPQIVRDAAISGVGCLRLRIDNGRIVAERIWPGNILVDDFSCVDVAPRSLYLRHYLDRYHAAALYADVPGAEAAIDGAPSGSSSWLAKRDESVELIEAWHLPSSETAGDGRHVLVVGDVVLLDEPWERGTFPLPILRLIPPQRKWWGEIPVLRVAPQQAELNKMCRRVEEALHLVAVPRVWLKQAAGGAIPPPKINNKIGAICNYQGEPPIFQVAQAMSPEVYAYMKDRRDSIFAGFGISQLSAQGYKPPGLNSGEAQRVYLETQSRRWINPERAVEDFVCDLARELVHLRQEIAEDDPDALVGYRMRDREDVAPWSEFQLDDTDYRIQLHPASALPNTPAGRLERLEAMKQSGAIQEGEFWELLDDPDFEFARRRYTSSLELIEKRLYLMVETGKYHGPTPQMDLQSALRLSQQHIQLAELDDVPEDRIDLMRDFWDETKALIERGEQEAAAAAAPAVPPGMPGAPAPAGLLPPAPPPGAPPPMPMGAMN